MNYSLILAGLVFALGMIGFVGRRSLLVQLLSAGMMLQAAILVFLAWGFFHESSSGTMGVIVILLLMQGEGTVGYLLLRKMQQVHGSWNVSHWERLSDPRHSFETIPEEELKTETPAPTPIPVVINLDPDLENSLTEDLE